MNTVELMDAHQTSQANATVAVRSSSMIVDLWMSSLLIGISGFKHKALADFMLNNFVGCSHGCLFCYVPEVSVRKLKRLLAKYGITDPDAEWGKYLFLRPMILKDFLRSLKVAQEYPAEKLHIGGHRAVMVSSTTDAFGPVFHPNRERQRELMQYRDDALVLALELIRDRTDLNVRILTRSTYAMRPRFVELFQSFGQRLIFGMSLPCLNDQLVRAYEPHASSASARLDKLNEARDAGLATFAAIAPIYPDVTDDELREVMTAVRDAGVMTAYVEPLHVRADNIERIRRGFEGTMIVPKLDVFENRKDTVKYAMRVLQTAERIAHEVGIGDRLHLWPDDKLLTSKAARKVITNWPAHEAWLQKWWNRVSEWPTAATTGESAHRSV